MSSFYKFYEKCTLCARGCGSNRVEGKLGYCSSGAIPHVARAALHFWEEPIISGERGSGTIFFTGCSLGCIYCQNREISRGEGGIPCDGGRIADIMMSLRDSGAHNVNFVTPTHFAPHVVDATAIARSRGFDIPVIYNTGGYDSVEALRSLEGTVDVYLPDLKYYRAKTAEEYSGARDYPEVARAAIEEMVASVGSPILHDGLIKKGVVVRVLLLPAHVAEAKLNLKYLYETYGNRIYISLMSQYTPPCTMPKPLDRRVTREEYGQLISYAEKLGVVNAFVQDYSSASESYIPPFDLTGVI